MNELLQPASPSEAAPCCAAFYEQAWVHTLLGESFHPGGPELSRELVEPLVLPVGARVLDVACGTGTTALLTARAHPQVEVVGVDFSTKNVDKARERARAAGAERVSFQAGDAADLPFDDASFDAVICECAVSTFADKPAVATEFRRVLRPKGQLALSDMCVYAALPEALAEFVAPWTCVADALTVEGYQSLFLEAGFRVWRYEDRSDTLRAMALDLKRKLVLVGLGQVAGGAGMGVADLGIEIDEARRLLDQATALAKAGTVQYATMHFCVGQPPARPAMKAGATSTAPSCDPSTGCC